MKYYTGYGSTDTPLTHIILFNILATQFQSDYLLRSCEEYGPCIAFREGARGQGELFIPWEDYNNSFSRYIISDFDKNLIKEAKKICLKPEISPDYSDHSEADRKIMIRNVFSLLGVNLSEKSRFLVYYCSDEDNDFKVRHLVKVANYFDIKIFNTYKEEHFNRILQFANRDNDFYDRARNILYSWRSNPIKGIPHFTDEDARKLLFFFKEIIND